MSKLTLERFYEILDGEVMRQIEGGCRILAGLNLIAKYLPKSGITVACHDQLFACGVQELLDAGITEDDALMLRDLTWFIDEEALSHFA